MITIVNYGMGNLGSVLNMFKRIGVPAKITSEIKEIESAEKLLLPGVGAFSAAMDLLNKKGFREVLDFKAKHQKIPILGICLGMQLLTNSSEEGNVAGLGWIDATTTKFVLNSQEYKIPHMGWNYIKPQNKSEILEKLDHESKFYFVHSYFVSCKNRDNALATTSYGRDFDAVIGQENIYGAQFHPEKSHKFGMQLFNNFAQL